MSIKSFIPPILVKYLQRTKQYKSFEEAASQKTKSSYQNEILCNVVAEKTKNYLAILNKKPYELKATDAFLLSAINNMLNETTSKTIHVVDYGGASGIHYFDIKRFFLEHYNVKWTVVETTQMVKSAKHFSLHNQNLYFTDELNSINSSIDILYSSCALHYVPKPYEVLEEMIAKKAKWVLFNRMMFNEADRELYTIQKSLLSGNGSGPLPKGYQDQVIFYPHTTLSYSKFLNHMQQSYTLEWAFDETTGVHAINREPVFGKGLLFKLKD